MKETGIVYLVTNLVNGRYYIGKTTKTLEHRWNQHVSDAKRGKGFHLHSAIRKYGADSFVVEQVTSANDSQSLAALENLWIVLTASWKYGVGYNKTFGGEGAPMPEEVKEKIRNANKRKKRSDETVARMSAARAGIKLSPEHCAAIGRSKKGNTYCLGRETSSETREKLSIAKRGTKIHPNTASALVEANKGNTYNVGKKLSKETIEKISKSLKGKPKSAEHVAKVAARHLGNTYWLGKTHTEETRERLRRNATGRKASPEALQNMSAAKKGVPWSEARRKAQRRSKVTTTVVS